MVQYLYRSTRLAPDQKRLVSRAVCSKRRRSSKSSVARSIYCRAMWRMVGKACCATLREGQGFANVIKVKASALTHTSRNGRHRGKAERRAYRKGVCLLRSQISLSMAGCVRAFHFCRKASVDYGMPRGFCQSLRSFDHAFVRSPISAVCPRIEWDTK